jgi:hypothetical protein
MKVVSSGRTFRSPDVVLSGYPALEMNQKSIWGITFSETRNWRPVTCGGSMVAVLGTKIMSLARAFPQARATDRENDRVHRLRPRASPRRARRRSATSSSPARLFSTTSPRHPPSLRTPRLGRLTEHLGQARQKADSFSDLSRRVGRRLVVGYEDGYDFFGRLPCFDGLL